MVACQGPLVIALGIFWNLAWISKSDQRPFFVTARSARKLQPLHASLTTVF
jgi:hypothetical protein